MPRRQTAVLIVFSLVLGAAGCKRSREAASPPSPLLHIKGSASATKAEPRLHVGDGPGRILDRVLEAYGGPDKLTRWYKGHIKYRTRTNFLDRVGAPEITFEEYFQLPGKFKRFTQMEANGFPITTVCIINGSEGWLYNSGGGCRPLPADSIKSMQRTEHLYADHCTLSRLFKPDTQLKVLGTATVQGKKTLVLHSQNGSEPAFENYLDMDTALLVKYRRSLPDSASGRTQWVETELSNYKVIEGGPVPMRIVSRDQDRLLLDVTVLELSFAPKLDAGLFDKP